MERHFFEQVLDAFDGFADDTHGERHAKAHRYGLKIWYDDAVKEHYEAQVIGGRTSDVALEIGFHSEYPKEPANQAVLEALLTHQKTWRKVLGKDAIAGEFLGADRWRRISETWPLPSFDDEEAAIEAAARLADYVDAIEPLRRGDQ